MPVAIRNPHHYQVLGLAVGAADEEIRAAYKKLALQWHPDRHLTAKEDAAQMFIEISKAYHSLMTGAESIDSSPAYAPTESNTARSFSPDPIPQATQSSRRPTSPSLRESEHKVRPFASSARSSSSTQSSQPRSSDGKTSFHASQDHHYIPKHRFTDPSSAGSDGSSRTSRISTLKSFDNLRSSPRPSSPGQGSPLSASHLHNSHTSNDPSHSKLHDNLRDRFRNQHESGQVSSSTAYSPRPGALNRSKNSHTTQEARPAYNPPKGGSRDPNLSESRIGKLSQPVIPRTPSKLHKRSPIGLGEELFHKLSKVPSKAKKDGATSSDNAPAYGSPLRPLGSPRGASKDWFFPLPLTLDEMFHGAAYRFLVTRELLSRKTEQVEISIEVPPGTRSGTRIVCPRTGHQCKDGTLQDIIFLVEGVPHDQLLRVKDDLFIDICVPWEEALVEQGADIYIDGIDGKQITFTLPYPIYDKSTEGEVLVAGAGMPIRKGRRTIGRGDMIVRWQVVFSGPSKWKAFKKVLRINM